MTCKSVPNPMSNPMSEDILDPTHVINFHFHLCRGGAVIRMSWWAEPNFVIAKFEELPRHETLTQHVILAPSRALR